MQSLAQSEHRRVQGQPAERRPQVEGVAAGAAAKTMKQVLPQVHGEDPAGRPFHRAVQDGLQHLRDGVVAQPAHGTVVLNSNGSFTYTPAANFNGADSFTYRASDGTAQSSIATVALTVTAANGDQLYFTFGGSGVRTAQGFDDTFLYTIVGGTGRFVGASGFGQILSSDKGVSAPFIDGRGHLVETSPFVFDLSGVLIKRS